MSDYKRLPLKPTPYMLAKASSVAVCFHEADEAGTLSYAELTSIYQAFLAAAPDPLLEVRNLMSQIQPAPKP